MMKVNILETDTGRIREDELRDWSQAALNQLDKAGYKSFRPGQLEAVNTILNDRDLIAVMPTGSGKSVCYQLPAMREGHLALVVSPLRALMRDQVQALQARGVAAALIDSGVTPKQRQSIYAMAHGGGLRILYVAPERLLGFGYGIRKTIRSLVGDTGEGVDDRGISELEGYGALENVDEDVIEARIHTLIDDGTIYVGQYHTLLEP